MKRLLLLFGLVNENACINGSHSHACALVGYQIETIAIVSQLASSGALNHPQWKKAMIEKMEALKKNGTWELITLPRGKRTVGCGWVYTLKHKADGSIERACIVAKGFTQTYGMASIISRRLFLWPN